ncbi:glutathione S-transferase family protein [Sedimentitalea todarodis]|uniref:Glutathione S-transferase n=1 Tax=Sedimentitalea todarodis TaxID=1631240 RepID=A0ABU3VKT4_9RHOB|nr:glutathione S-transferase [Sedimentitalea todarodis]MDU9006799.1 glutathione S-transferase [Sedimentitalea todarodis]
MTLHYAPGTISIATAIALFDADLPFKAIKVDFGSGEQTRPAYHRINPKGRVPALETGQGILTETGALLEYVAATAPEAGLVPQSVVEAARMREVMYYLASTMHVNHAHRMRGSRWATRQESFDDMAAKVPETMAESAAHIEAHGLAGPYVLGDAFSIADPYLFVICNWLGGDGVDTSAFPRISAFMDAMNARTSVQKARAKGMI